MCYSLNNVLFFVFTSFIIHFETMIIILIQHIVVHIFFENVIIKIKITSVIIQFLINYYNGTFLQ